MRVLGSALLLSACGGRAVLDQSNPASGGDSADSDPYRGRIATFDVASKAILIYPPNPASSQAPIARFEPENQFQDCPDLALDGQGTVYELCHRLFTPSEPNHIDIFAPDASDAGAPTRKIEGDDTGLSQEVMRVAVDAAGYIYVVQYNDLLTLGAGSVTVFAPGADGDALPVRAFTVPAGTGAVPTAIACDRQGQIFVGYAFGDPVRVFAEDASGDAEPVRSFGGDSIQFSDVEDLMVDANGLVYVLSILTGQLQLSVYGAGATEGDAPLRTAMLGEYDAANGEWGIDVDASGRLFLAGGTSLQVFSANASGVPRAILELGRSTKNAVAIAP